MAESHVVSALKEKRIQVASQIESLQAQMRQATIDLDHVEAALRLFDPDVDLAALSPRKVAPVLYDTKGDTGRVILDTLRNSMRPLTTAQVCEAVMKDQRAIRIRRPGQPDPPTAGRKRGEAGACAQPDDDLPHGQRKHPERRAVSAAPSRLSVRPIR